MVAVKDGDQATAESCLIEAEKLEPDLVDLGDLRLQSCALKRDFAGVVSELLRFARKYKGHGITPRMLTEPVFDEFKKSPEFAEWAALLEAQP